MHKRALASFVFKQDVRFARIGRTDATCGAQARHAAAVAEDIDALLFRKGRRRREAHVVVVVAADGDDRSLARGDLFDGGIEQIFRLRRREKGVEHVSRDQDKLDAFALAKVRDLT